MIILLSIRYSKTTKILLISDLLKLFILSLQATPSWSEMLIDGRERCESQTRSHRLVCWEAFQRKVTTMFWRIYKGEKEEEEGSRRQNTSATAGVAAANAILLLAYIIDRNSLRWRPWFGTYKWRKKRLIARTPPERGFLERLDGTQRARWTSEGWQRCGRWTVDGLRRANPCSCCVLLERVIKYMQMRGTRL